MNSFSKTMTAIVKKFLPVLSGLVLVVSFSLVTAVPVAAQATLHVPSDDYPTIHAAIDAANPEGGDTINVAEGLYVEADGLIIDKPLTLQGAGTALTTVENPFNSQKTTWPLKITGDNVIVKDFTLVGPGSGTILWVDGASGVVIEDIVLTTSTSEGICLEGSTGCTFTNVTVQDIISSDHDAIGLRFKGGGGHTFTGLTIDGVTAGNWAKGIELATLVAGTDGNSFTGTTITNVTSNGESNDEARGIELGSLGVSDTTFSDTEISDITSNGNIRGISTHYDVSLNSFTNTRILRLSASERAYGIYDIGNSNTFTSNYITGNNIGIKIQQSVDASTISLNLNYIYSNTNYGVDNTDGTSDADAENNWWGASDGPSTNPGSGDKVSGNVDYDPWLVLNISANPINIAADGSSTSTITADMTKNSDGEDTSTSGHIPDGTQIVLTTNKGSIGSTTVTKTTVSGVTTATLTSSTESGIATVRATANSASGATAIFFIAEGDTEVESSKTEITSSGDDTVDAKTGADTEVDKSGTGTPTITVAQYEGNPGGAPAFATVDKYIDVHIDDTTNVDEIVTKIYYTEAEIEGLSESALIMHWWNGSTWVSCSDSGVTYPAGGPTYRGFMWAEVRADTIPNLTDLKGAIFGLGIAPSGGGVQTAAGTNSLYGFVNRGGILTETFVAESFDGMCRLTLEKGTRAQTKHYTLTYVGMFEMSTSLPLPEEAKVVGVVYSFKPVGAMFDPPATLECTYDPADIPEGIPEQNLVIAYWDAGANNWVKLDSTVDIKAKTVTAKVCHFTAFAVLAFKPAPAAFTVAELNLSPDEVNIGETVNISALVSNTGGTTGSHTFTLNIDGVVEATKDVTVDAGTSQEVSFTISKNIAGSYSVDVNRLNGSFVVKEKTSSVSITEPVAPSSTPPAKTINWPILGGIIAALVVVGSAVVFLTRRGY